MFLILSDTHGFESVDGAVPPQKLRLPTPRADVLLHCGDLTHVGEVPSFKKALKMLRSIDAELKLVIAGNHDLELDRTYWEAHHEDYKGKPEDHHQAVRTMTGSPAAEAGVTYLNEGTHSFVLKSGAALRIYVSPYTPAFCDWAFAYAHNEDRFNAQHQVADGATSIARNPIPSDVDIIMTHGPPKGILDWCPGGSVGCENLLQALRRVKPMLHCFGHIHEGNGIEKIDWREQDGDQVPGFEGELAPTHFAENPYPNPFVCNAGHRDQTLAVNAAIMTAENSPDNSPWLISLDLPRIQ